MKTAQYIITASCLALLAHPGFGQDTTKPAATPTPPASSTAAQPAAAGAAQNQTRPARTAGNPASAATEQSQLINSHALKNRKVFDMQGREFGQFEGILFDSKSGRARYGIVELNKDWQLNDPEIVVPWSAFQVTKRSADDYEIKLNTTKEKVQKAPKFDPNNVDQLATREKGQPIYAYWAIMWVDDDTVAPLATQSSTAEGTSTSGSATKGAASSSNTGNTPDSKATRATGAGADNQPRQQ